MPNCDISWSDFFVNKYQRSHGFKQYVEWIKNHSAYWHFKCRARSDYLCRSNPSYLPLRAIEVHIYSCVRQCVCLKVHLSQRLTMWTYSIATVHRPSVSSSSLSLSIPSTVNTSLDQRLCAASLEQVFIRKVGVGGVRGSSPWKFWKI